MLKHKTHYGESLNLNWQSELHIGTRVVVGKGTLVKLHDLLVQTDAGDKILLLKQPGLFIQEIDHLKTELHGGKISVHVLEIPDGEACKSTDYLIKIWNALHQLKFSRRDTVVGMGGGTVTDIAGFAASTYLRGMNLITIPTTLLAQVDAAIGGKTAVNFHSGKNLIGSYYFATAVIVDTQTLSTLPRSQFTSGLAEVIKYALLEKTIANETEYLMGPSSLFKVLEKSIKDLDWNNELLPGILTASIKMKLAVVAHDPQEKGLRRCLNLGHTLGHALESTTEFAINHGEAVAIGMAFALHMAVSYKQLSESDRDRALNLIESAGLPFKMPAGISRSVLLEHLFRDKKREGEAIKMILPKGELTVVTYNELIKREEIERMLDNF